MRSSFQIPNHANFLFIGYIKLKIGSSCALKVRSAVRFRKAGRMWCRGARETEPHGTIEWLLPKGNSLSDLPAFLCPYGMFSFNWRKAMHNNLFMKKVNFSFHFCREKIRYQQNVFVTTTTSLTNKRMLTRLILNVRAHFLTWMRPWSVSLFYPATPDPPIVESLKNATLFLTMDYLVSTALS